MTIKSFVSFLQFKNTQEKYIKYLYVCFRYTR